MTKRNGRPRMNTSYDERPGAPRRRQNSRRNSDQRQADVEAPGDLAGRRIMARIRAGELDPERVRAAWLLGHREAAAAMKARVPTFEKTVRRKEWPPFISGLDKLQINELAEYSKRCVMHVEPAWRATMDEHATAVDQLMNIDGENQELLELMLDVIVDGGLVQKWIAAAAYDAQWVFLATRKYELQSRGVKALHRECVAKTNDVAGSATVAAGWFHGLRSGLKLTKDVASDVHDWHWETAYGQQVHIGAASEAAWQRKLLARILMNEIDVPRESALVLPVRANSIRRRMNAKHDEALRGLERRVLGGDLSAVTALARIYERVGLGSAPVEDVLERIDAMKESGPLGVEARRAIHNAVKPSFTDEAVVRIARAQHHVDGAIEIDEGAEVSVGDEYGTDGCYVQAWVWVDLQPEEFQRLQQSSSRAESAE